MGEVVVVIEIADEGMAFEKSQRELGRWLGEQGLQIPQTPRTLLKGAGGTVYSSRYEDPE